MHSEQGNANLANDQNAPKNGEAQSFTDTLFCLQNSEAYSQFCEKVYGRNLCQFNVLDEEQLQHLLSALEIQPSHSVLDIGCGPGFISEYISDVTGAKVTGVDFAGQAMKAARARTMDKANRLQFVEGNLDSLPSVLGQFDFIVSVDTLCFADDLLSCMKQVRSLLKPTGIFAAFCSYTQKEAPLGDLDPRTSRYGQALTQAGFTFQVFGYSLNERIIWEAERTLTFIKEERRARTFFLTD